MRKASTRLMRSRGLNRRPLLRASSPLKINRGLTLGLVLQTGAHQRHWYLFFVFLKCVVGEPTDHS
jgi:hypothetical protein